jgi:hypothetical protein
MPNYNDQWMPLEEFMSLPYWRQNVWSAVYQSALRYWDMGGWEVHFKMNYKMN